MTTDPTDSAETAPEAPAGASTDAGLEDETPLSPRWGVLCAAVATLLLALACSWHLREGDVFWEIKAGVRMLATHHYPRTDEFSWIAAGRPWHPNSWGFDVLAALVWKAGGFSLVGRMVTLLASATFVGLFVRARRVGAGLVEASIALLLGTPILLGAVTARPQTMSYLLFVGMLLSLDRAVASSGRRRLWWWAAIALEQLVWINIHSMALIAIPLVGAYVAGWALEQRMAGRSLVPSSLVRAAFPSLVPGLAAAAGMAVISCANPRGLAVFSDAVQVRAASLGVIIEWSPVWTHASWLLALLLIAGPTVIAFRQGRYRQVAAMVVIGGATINAARFLPLAFLLGHAEIAVAFTLLGRLAVVRPWRTSLAALAACMFPLLLPSSFGGLTSPGSLRADKEPLAAIQAIPAGCRLYNEFTAGGLIILERWPQVKVSMDGRNDMYGRQLVLDNIRTFDVADGPTALNELYQNKVTCVLSYTSRPLNDLLSGERDWRIKYQDRYATVWVRNSPAG